MSRFGGIGIQSNLIQFTTEARDLIFKISPDYINLVIRSLDLSLHIVLSPLHFAQSRLTRFLEFSLVATGVLEGFVKLLPKTIHHISKSLGLTNSPHALPLADL